MISWWQYIQIWLYLGFNHQRRKCEGSPPKYLWPISYFGSIWELYVLDLKTKVFCRKKNQLHFSHGQGHELRTLGEEIAFTERPKIHSHSQTFRSGWSIFCLPHRPKFSDFFDLCLHWVSVVRGQGHFKISNFIVNINSIFLLIQCFMAHCLSVIDKCK